MDDASLGLPEQTGELVTPAAPPPYRPRPRWYQFRLRTLLIVVTISAVAAGTWRTIADVLPYRRQQRTKALVEQLGGSYQTAEASKWHRRLFGDDLQNLVLVNLADCDVPDRYIEAIADLPQLETLAVGCETFTDQHLGQLHRTASLRYLVLDSTSVSDEAVTALRTAQPNVEVYFSERRAMAALKGIGPLHEGPADVPPLLRERLGDAYFHSCQSACCGSKLNDTLAAKMRHLRNLEELILSHSAVGDPGLAHLQGLVKLQELSLSHRPITDAGLAHVAGLANLRVLRLSETQITDAGLAHLQGLSRLGELDITNTPISDRGLRHLHQLSRLQSLTVSSTAVTETGIADLQQALPKCRVRRLPAGQ
jgi:hypothetical protein